MLDSWGAVYIVDCQTLQATLETDLFDVHHYYSLSGILDADIS